MYTRTLFHLIFSLILALSALVRAEGPHAEMQQQEMLQELHFIKNILQHNYALGEWKRYYFGWDLQHEMEKAEYKILSSPNPSLKEYQQLLKTFLKSTQDYHVEVLFFSTEMSSLPFDVEQVENSYYISRIDPDYAASAENGFSAGDEILEFDGVPVHEAVQQFLREGNRGGNAASDMALAQTYLTWRRARQGHEVPQGAVTICVRKAGSDHISTHQLEWSYYAEQVRQGPLEKRMATHVEGKKLGEHRFFKKLCMLPGYESVIQPDLQHPIGEKQSILPILGKMQWQADPDAPFQAYIFKHKNLKLGFIRIGSYFEDDCEWAVQEFAKIIWEMQSRTDGLIIDQMNNPGGDLIYLYALASLLSDTPLDVPKHRISLTQEDLYFALMECPELEQVPSDKVAKQLLGNSLQGIPVTRQVAEGIHAHLQFIIDEWNAGRQLTEPAYLLGIGPIAPHPKIRYTKPILVLINRLDFSGGDFFPAILQDNKRAVLMGTPTAGAGGYVNTVSFPNLHAVSHFTYTASMAERIDSRPIENIGVDPDIFYEVTAEDLRYSYQQFSQEILQAIEKMCPKPQNERRQRWRYR
jgi:hypothetical protein